VGVVFGNGTYFRAVPKYQKCSGVISQNTDLTFGKTSMNIIRDFPLTGAGFGVIWTSIPPTGQSHRKGSPDHAHNDYIELFTNGGAISVMLLFWFSLWSLQVMDKAFQRRRDPYSLFLYSGILAGIFSMLLHGIDGF